jgi:excisionase family DNA binding protein
VPDIDLDALGSVVAGLLADRLADRLAERLGAAAKRPYLTISHAALYADLSEDSIRSLIATGKLSGFRPVPGRVLVSRDELDAHIRSSTREPRRGRGRYTRRQTEAGL